MANGEEVKKIYLMEPEYFSNLDGRPPDTSGQPCQQNKNV